VSAFLDGPKQDTKATFWAIYR